MLRKLAVFVSVSAAMLFSQPLRGETWQASVGGQSSDKAVQVLAFLPNEMWIHAGDSVTWTFNSDEIHSVTFLKAGQSRPTFAVGCPPNVTTPDPSTFTGTNCVNSGLIKTPGTTYTVTFPNPGNYVVVCLIHVNQSGTIHVLSASEALPHDQDFYDRQAAIEQHDLLSDGDGGLASKLREDTVRGFGEEHHHAHQPLVVLGAGEYAPTPGGAQSVSKMRFDHESITIHAGQTVEWASSDVSGHSVTFGEEPPGGFTPLSPPTASAGVVFSTDPDGALHATLTSTADSVHSGRLAPAAQERTNLGQLPPGATRFRITFTTPGIYPYKCAFHDELGMTGQVVVLPQE
jgi:plastocyanin